MFTRTLLLLCKATKLQLPWYLINYISLLYRGVKVVYQLNSKVTDNLFIKTQMMWYKRAWQNQIGLLYNITKTKNKQYRQ